jgi:hypothetical protein
VDAGVFQVTTPNSTRVEDYGVYDTSTLEKDATAVVNVTFALKKLAFVLAPAWSRRGLSRMSRSATGGTGRCSELESDL